MDTTAVLLICLAVIVLCFVLVYQKVKSDKKEGTFNPIRLKVALFFVLLAIGYGAYNYFTN